MCEGGGVGSAHAKQSFPVSTTVDAYNYSNITIAYIKNHAIQTINETYGNSTKHLRKQSFSIVLKPK